MNTSSENNSVEKQQPETETKTPDTIRQVMIFNVPKITEIIDKLTEQKFQFRARHAGKFTRIIPATLNDKMAIIPFLKANKVQFYNVLNARAPVKVVIKGLQETFPTEILKGMLNDKNFQILAINQFTTFKERKPLPYFQIQLPYIDHSKEIFKLTSLGNYDIGGRTIGHLTTPT